MIDRMVAEAAAGKSKHQQLRAQAKAKKAAEAAAHQTALKNGEAKDTDVKTS